jgi:hypothetical protein
MSNEPRRGSGPLNSSIAIPPHGRPLIRRRRRMGPSAPAPIERPASARGTYSALKTNAYFACRLSHGRYEQGPGPYSSARTGRSLWPPRTIADRFTYGTCESSETDWVKRDSTGALHHARPRTRVQISQEGSANLPNSAGAPVQVPWTRQANRQETRSRELASFSLDRDSICRAGDDQHR